MLIDVKHPRLSVLRQCDLIGLPRSSLSYRAQGSQFTSAAFTGVISGAGVRISMDGVRRPYDNIFVERLWRSLKYEEVYLRDYGTVPEARQGIGQWFEFYNHRRPHQALAYRTPAEVYGITGGLRTGNGAGATRAAIAPVGLRPPCATAALAGQVNPS